MKSSIARRVSGVNDNPATRYTFSSAAINRHFMHPFEMRQGVVEKPDTSFAPRFAAIGHIASLFRKGRHRLEAFPIRQAPQIGVGSHQIVEMRCARAGQPNDDDRCSDLFSMHCWIAADEISGKEPIRENLKRLGARHQFPCPREATFSAHSVHVHMDPFEERIVGTEIFQPSINPGLVNQRVRVEHHVGAHRVHSSQHLNDGGRKPWVRKIVEGHRCRAFAHQPTTLFDRSSPIFSAS